MSHGVHAVQHEAEHKMKHDANTAATAAADGDCSKAATRRSRC